MQAKDLLLVWSISSSVLADTTYQSPMGDEEWRANGNRLRCGLSLQIPSYGVAYFEQIAARPPYFIIEKWQKLDKSYPMKLFSVPPVWKPKDKMQSIVNGEISRGRYAIFLSRNVTLNMLAELNRGNLTSFRYRDETGAVNVSLSPINFKPTYDKYIKCVGNLLSFDFKSVEKSTLHFDIESGDIKDEDKAQLNRVIAYIKADKDVRYVRIAGYTDDSGRKSVNNAVSEARARAVALYMTNRGITEKQIKITWYGLKNPIMPNDTDEGREANRRVEIQIVAK